MNFYGIALEAQRRAAGKRIELLPTPPEEFLADDGTKSDDGWTGENFIVYPHTPKGHYLNLGIYGLGAQIVAIDDFRSETSTYDDLIPGFKLMKIVEMEIVLKGDETPKYCAELKSRKFISIEYEYSKV